MAIIFLYFYCFNVFFWKIILTFQAAQQLWYFPSNTQYITTCEYTDTVHSVYMLFLAFLCSLFFHNLHSTCPLVKDITS